VVGVAGLTGKAVDALDAAVADPVGTLAAIGDASLSAADALGNAVMHPVDTANQLANDVSKLAGTLKDSATKYVDTHSVNEIAEDLLRVGVGALAEAGIGKAVGAAGTVASKSLGLADEAAAVAGAMRKADKVGDALPAPEGSFSSFSIIDWSGYPEALPKPSGPFRLLEGAEYDAARKAANSANKGLHRADASLRGLEIHEIQPVKFGGSPTAAANKIPLAHSQHVDVTNWWKQLQRDLTRR
jgi:hypothetical protein